MPEESITPPQNENAGASDDHLKRTSPATSSDKSWQPLGSEPPAGEDLASIFQSASTLGQMDADDADLPWTPPNDITPASPPEVTQGQSSVWRFDQAELAELAETVFDTTFYLVPWLDEHFLLGDLAQHLRLWLPELCERFGWELSLLSIRPDYLRWTLLDFPECLTRQMLAIVRQRVSAQIFEVFPDLQTSSSAQDFWSPGYLVDTLNRDFHTQDLLTHLSADRSAAG